MRLIPSNLYIFIKKISIHKIFVEHLALVLLSVGAFGTFFALFCSSFIIVAFAVSFSYHSFSHLSPFNLKKLFH